MPHMAPVQKVKKGRPLAGFPNTDPVVTITDALTPITVDSEAEVGSYVATAVDAEQGDIASSLVWTTKTVVAGEGSQIVDTGGEGGELATGLANDRTAGEADALVATLPAGTVVPGLPAATYDVDVTYDVGGLQTLSIIVAGGEDYDALALLIDTASGANGDEQYNNGSFTATSVTLGVGSTAVIAAGTAGSGGGDLFAAITVATSNAVTFPAPTAGTDGTIYTASITVDGGGGQPISIPGYLAQTYTLLVGQLNADTTGAVWDLSGLGIDDGPRAVSDSTGASSTILIADTTLFAALTQFQGIASAVPGTDDVFGIVGTGASPAITFPLVGAQTLTATATDAFAATGFDTAAVTVNPPV